MSLLSVISTTTRTNVSKEPIMVIMLQRLSRHVVCAELGVVGGAIGVMLTIGLAVIVQALLPPTMIFSPTVTLFMVIAAVISLGVSWLLGRTLYRVFPRLFYNLDKQGLQIMLTFSVFTGLLQAILFMRIL